MNQEMLHCPDCGTPMNLLEQTPERVLYLCPSCYPQDPRHGDAMNQQRHS